MVCYDPLARDAARNELKDKALVLDSVKACLDQADVVVIANADPEFARLTSEDFPQRSPPVQVIDCWRLLRPQLEGSANVRYRAIGVAGDVGDTHCTGMAARQLTINHAFIGISEAAQLIACPQGPA